MKSFLLKRALSPSLFFLAVGALIHCGGDDNNGTSFSTQGDTAVMAGIVGTWMGTSNAGTTYTLTLCEDKSSTLITEDSCQTLHTVRGQGRGATETVSKPDQGCGGCDYDNSAYVTGTIDGDDLASDFHGQIQLTGGDVNGLGFPYKIDFEGTGSFAPTFAIDGVMQSPGSFDADHLYYAPTTAPAVDGGDQDASDSDSGTVAPAPSTSASAAPQPSAGPFDSTAVVTGIAFHRVGDAACP
jgi:hypothetical protein